MADSFVDLIKDPAEVRRVLDGYVFNQGVSIKDFGDFEIAFRQGFNTPKGENANITTDTILQFFQTEYAKEHLKDSLSSQEYENVYGDGVEKVYTSPRDRRVVVVEIPRIESKGYQRKGRPVKKYSRTKPKDYTPAQEKFIKARVQKGYKPKAIQSDFNKHFAKSPKTYSSIKSKSYRV